MTPSVLLEIVGGLPFARGSKGDLINEKLIVPEAYTYPLVQQDSGDEAINRLFSELGPRDAYVPIIVRNERVLQKIRSEGNGNKGIISQAD